MTQRADAVVVGAGLAGLSAAVRVASSGASVVVLERDSAESYLCNSRYTGGLFHIAMDDMAGEPGWVLENVVKATYGRTQIELAKALVETAPRALRWIRNQGVQIIKGGPDGLRKHALAPPGIRQTGLNPNGRPYWTGRAGDVMLRVLGERLAGHGGRILRGHRAKRLIMSGSQCRGVEVDTDSGSVVFSADSVVLADGGFQANHELLKRFISPAPEKLLQRNARSGFGDCLRMAEAVGAKLVGMESFYGHLLARDALSDDRLWPYPMLDSAVCAGIIVDRTGNRFCDEGRGGIYVANMIARLEDPLSIVAIFDSDIWDVGPARDFLLPANPNYLNAGGRLLSADTLSDLARMVDIDPDGLDATVKIHNRIAAGESINAGSVPRTSQKSRPWPIVKPPFHAIPLCAGITYTMGGIATDVDGRVLSKDGVISGLFAAGACTGGLEGWMEAGYSGGLSKALVFGLRAGERIMQEKNEAGRGH